MGSTFIYPSKSWPKERGDDQSIDEEDAEDSVTARDASEDLDILHDRIVSLTARSGLVRRERGPARLPAVDAFDFEEACRAKSLAHKFGPQNRYRNPEGDPSDSQALYREQEEERSPDWPDAPEDRAAPRGSRRGFFWGFGTALAIVIAAPIVYGLVRPSNDQPVAPVGEVRTDTSAERGASSADQARQPDSADVAESGAQSASSNVTVLTQTEPTTAAILEPVSDTFAATAFRPATTESGTSKFVRADDPAAANATASGFDGATPQPVDVDSDATEIEPAPPDSPSMADADGGGKDFAQMAESQLYVNADPSSTDGGVGVANKEPASAATASVVSSLSAAQIDRLLARGEDLLRNGNIVSARLLFLRVAAAGDRRGAKAVGMTYDPEVYARLPVIGLTPDREQAEVWYEKAGKDLIYTIDLTLPEAAQADGAEAEDQAKQQWNAACARKYQSFEPSTGLYTALSGAKRPCRLP